MTRFLPLALAAILLPGLSLAQSPPSGRRGAVEFTAGYAGFVDDATADHSVVGGSARLYVTPRLSVGPEVVYMRGPGSDRDLFVTGNLTIDLLGDDGRTRRVVPFIVAGAGVMRHSDRFGLATFTSSEGAFTAGAGVRGRITNRLFVGGDVRLGWELHARVTGIVGVILGG